MKKYVISGIVVIVLIFTIGACSKKTKETLREQTHETTGTAEVESITLTAEEKHYFDVIYTEGNKILKKYDLIKDKINNGELSSDEFKEFSKPYEEMVKETTPNWSRGYLVYDAKEVENEMKDIQYVIQAMVDTDGEIVPSEVRKFYELSLETKEVIKEKEDSEERMSSFSEELDTKMSIDKEIEEVGVRLEKAIEANDNEELKKLSKEMDVLEEKLKEVYAD